MLVGLICLTPTIRCSAHDGRSACDAQRVRKRDLCVSSRSYFPERSTIDARDEKLVQPHP